MAVSTQFIPLGFPAPEFSLPDVVTGKTLTLSDIKTDKGFVIVFLCNHCPYVKHIIHELVKTANDYIARGIGFAAISSNDVVNYPQDSPEKMKELAEALQFPFPYLYDESQEVAKAYQAACTPDFNVFDHRGLCVYRGQFDDSRPSNGKPATGADLRNTLDLVLAQQPVPENQIPGTGCGIKWKV